MTLSVDKFKANPKQWSQHLIDDMCWFRKLSPEDIDKYGEYLNFDILLQSQPDNVTEDIIRKYQDTFDESTWKRICYKKDNLSLKFMREFCNHPYFYWPYICQFQHNLTEEFIEEHKNEVSWGNLFGFQNLSGDFVRKHIKEVKRRQDWVDVSAGCDLDEAFIIKYKSKLVWEHVLQHQRITPTIITECKKYINFDKLLNDVDCYVNYKHTQYCLRVIFNTAPKKIKIRNYSLWRNKLTVDFVREFKDRFANDDKWHFVKNKMRTDKLRREFITNMDRKYWANYGI